MNELAAAHPRCGYRRICALLCGEGFAVNRKRRIERLWRAEGHRVPPRRSQASGRKAQGRAANAPWNLAASAPNQIWSYDFIAARTRTGAPLLILNVADEYAQVALGCRVDRSIGAAEVIAELDRLFARHGRLRLLRSDNGREFIAASLADLLRERGGAPGLHRERIAAAETPTSSAATARCVTSS
jgi:transposase InsO family protein